MESFLVQIFITLIVCGLFYYIYTLVMPRLPFIAEPFRGWLHILVLIAIACIIVFYVLIPLVRLLPRLLH